MTSTMAENNSNQSCNDPPAYRCYHCKFSHNEARCILVHSIRNHPTAKFKVCRRMLHESTGQLGYQTYQFNVTNADIEGQLGQGQKCIIDFDHLQLRYKRAELHNIDSSTPSTDSSKTTFSQEVPTTSLNLIPSTDGISKSDNLPKNDSDIPIAGDSLDERAVPEIPLNSEHITEAMTYIPEVLRVIEETGRRQDFLSLLKSLSNGTLSPTNISLHLLLDIGNFLSVETVNEVRYNKLTMDFWSLVQKMFRSKATRFFRGHMAGDTEAQGTLRTADCRFNFVVPSQNALARHSLKYQMDASKPGILNKCIDSLACTNATDVKISIDGKKIAYGFGQNLGDEDLCGHEASPSLEERQAVLGQQQEQINKLIDTFVMLTVDDGSLQHIPPDDKEIIRNDILSVIEFLSNDVRELRQMTVKKKHALSLLKKKVDVDWKASKLAGSISYLQTKIIMANSCCHGLLQCIDDLGFLTAILNGRSYNYTRGFGVSVNLQHQANFVCLQQFQDDIAGELHIGQSKIIKQRTNKWSSMREEAAVTGSTWYSAIGLRGLKEQRSHYETFFEKKRKEPSPQLQQYFDHGTVNEINGLATLVGKIMPVYYPDMRYIEDGCEIIAMPCSDKYAVVSGDGTGEDSVGNSCIAFEIKCPMPGKKFTTDVTYSLPVHYSIQVLSQMETKGCKEYANICYSENSTTAVAGQHDPDLFKQVMDVTSEIYSEAKKPTKSNPSGQHMKTSLQDFARSSKLFAEFPSLRGIPCSCSDIPSNDTTKVYNTHGDSRPSNQTLSSEECAAICRQVDLKHKEAYNLLRRPAKEVLVTVASDLERSHSSGEKPHAIPIAYHMSGFSLKMSSVRGLLQDVIQACNQKNLQVQVVAFDGQFLEIAIQSETGHPLTLCKLQKQVWQAARKLSKKELLDYMTSLTQLPQNELMANFTVVRSQGCISIGLKERKKALHTQHNISRYVVKDTTIASTTTSITEDIEVDEETDIILQYLPSHIVSTLDNESLDLIRAASVKISEPANPKPTEKSSCPETDFPEIDISADIHYEAILCALIAGKNGSKFISFSIEDLKDKFQNGLLINKTFTVQELKTILQVLSVQPSTGKKADLVLQVSQIFGDGSKAPIKPKMYNPLSLKSCTMKHLNNWPVIALCILYCNNTMEAKIQEWNDKSHFKPKCSLEFEDGRQLEIAQWYAVPDVQNGKPVQHIIDPHHIYVNNRARVCSNGLPGLGIYRKAWVKVAENSRLNETGLTLELVNELRDRQRNSYAETTFSASVENEMVINNDLLEAEWCALIRGWYQAIDQSGLDISTRMDKLLKMRSYLLSHYNAFEFPPPGGYVKSLPIAQFEGILTNIDRRIQLYSLTQSGSYNQRAISSLDSETFFSSFQDLDPKGTGVLRADDIPIALGNASFILEQRLNSERGFHLTTARSRVYKCNPFSISSDSVGQLSAMEISQSSSKANENIIFIKSHEFDQEGRKTPKPKRKSGTISQIQQPSRGAAGVREFHKTNEEKIMPHRRCGFTDAEVDM